MGCFNQLGKMEILILYHVVVNSQLNRDNVVKCYIIVFVVVG